MEAITEVTVIGDRGDADWETKVSTVSKETIEGLKPIIKAVLSSSNKWQNYPY